MSARGNAVRRAGLGLAGVLVASAACTRTAREGTSDANATGAASAGTSVAPVGSTPPDHLAPGELVEGSERAFGIALPRGMQITQSFVDLVVATGPVSVQALSRYLGARLEGGTLGEGKDSATFEHVAARGQREPELFVEIRSTFGGARLEIHKVTHQQVHLLPDEEARWRQVGLTPQGKVIDPSHAE
jgi:hypothetical protein